MQKCGTLIRTFEEWRQFVSLQFTTRIDESRLYFLCISDIFMVAMMKAKPRFDWARQSLA